MSEVPVVVLRWSARIAGLAIAGLYFMLMAGEIVSPHSGPPSTPAEWAGIVLASASCVAMLAAWRWELPGAVVSLAALILFVAVIRFRSFQDYDVVALAALPGVLYLMDWWVRRWMAAHAHSH